MIVADEVPVVDVVGANVNVVVQVGSDVVGSKVFSADVGVRVS